MTFLSPVLGLIAAAIAIPSLVILYFLKLRRREIEISSTILWRKAIQDLQANAPFQRLRKNILLLLQLIVLAGILFALAQPELDTSTDRGTRHILLIDRSASMRTTDADGRSRLDRAKQRARELVDSLRAPGPFSGDKADEAMVIAFDVSGEVVAQFTSDKALLKAAIDSIEPSDAPSRLADAMRLARAQATPSTRVERYVNEEGVTEERVIEEAPRGIGTLHMFTDGRLPDSDESLESVEDEIVYYAPDDKEPFNLGIVSVQAARRYDDPTRVSVFIGISGSVRERVLPEVEVRIADQVRVFPVEVLPSEPDRNPAPAPPPAPDAPIVVTPLPLPAAGSATIEIVHPGAGLVTVRLAGEAMSRDSLATDNVAWLVIPEARRLSVAAVTDGNPYLANALNGMPLAKLRYFTPDEWAAAMSTPEAREFDVVVLDRWAPPDGQALAPGRYLCLGTTPAPPLGPTVEEEVERAQFTLASRDHPVTRGLILDSVLIARINRVTIPEESAIRILAETDQGPGIIECIGPEVRVIATTFDPLKSNWPFDVSFPLFIADAVDNLATEAPDAEGSGIIRPGSVLSDRLPSSAADVQITEPDARGSPSGETHSITPAADGRIVYGPLRRSGLYRIAWKGPGARDDFEEQGRTVRYFTANLVDAVESDTTVAPELALASRVVVASEIGETKVRTRLWPWFILGAIAFVMFEWFIYNRKVHV